MAQFAINGNSFGVAEFHFVAVGGGDVAPLAYLKYKLDRCFVKSWTTSGSADDRPIEEVAFYYNKIDFQYAQSVDTNKFQLGQAMAWGNRKQVKWKDHGIKFDLKAVTTKAR